MAYNNCEVQEILTIAVSKHCQQTIPVSFRTTLLHGHLEPSSFLDLQQPPLWLCSRSQSLPTNNTFERLLRTGSRATRNSRVPTEVETSSGLNTKYDRGETRTV